MLPRTGVAQFDSSPGDIAGNVKRIVRWIGEAKGRGMQLVVFPEESISGYCVGDLNRNRMFVEASFRALEESIVPASTGIAVVVGLVAPVADRRLVDGSLGAENAFAVAVDGKLTHLGAKGLLVDDGVFYDSRYFLPASPDRFQPVEVISGGPKAGIMICHDMWDDHSDLKPSRLLADRGADFLVVINSSPFELGKEQRRREVAARRCRETGLPLVYVNTAGIQDNGKNVVIFDGGSFALDKDGRPIASCPRFHQGFFTLSEHAVRTDSTGGRIEELLAALDYGVKGFFHRTGHSRAVIGLSGGVDSSLSACLLVRALGPKNVLGINMPTRFSSDTTQANAKELARRLGIEYVVHPIENTVRGKKAEYEAVTGSEMQTLTFENIQARERGNVLMTYAQERGGLVIGNGNKTEFQRGYATMYGDIVGALMPLGDVAKTDVYRLAGLLNDAHGNPIPEEVISIPPSAELSAAQDVEKGQGDPFDYDVEAPLGQELIEFERTPAELRELFEQRRLDPAIWSPVRSSTTVYDKVSPAEFEKLAWDVFRGLEKSVFKRIQAPPVLKISHKAFGFDFRESVFARSTFPAGPRRT